MAAAGTSDSARSSSACWSGYGLPGSITATGPASGPTRYTLVWAAGGSVGERSASTRIPGATGTGVAGTSSVAAGTRPHTCSYSASTVGSLTVPIAGSQRG